MDKNEVEKRVMERLESSVIKQRKLAKKILLSVFLSIGFIFIALGAAMYLLNITDAESGMNPGMIFIPLGVFFAVMGVIVSLCIGNGFDYESYKKRLKDGVCYSYYDMQATIAYLEARIEVLEEEVESLK